MGTSSEADASLGELFELSPDAILLFKDGLIVRANPAAATLLRASGPGDLVGRRSTELLHPDSIPIVERHVARLMADDSATTRSEEKYLRLDGTVVHVEATGARARFYDGKAFIVFLRDIGDRKEVEERRKREQEAAARAEAMQERVRWLREIIDVIPSIVFARGERGEYVLVNKACADFYARPPEELLGRTLAELGIDGAAQWAQEDAQILAKGEALWVAERFAIDGRGQRRIVEGVKLKVQLGKGWGVLGVMTELTERRQLEAQLVHSQKMEAIGRLAGGIAHDFNNLLTVIIESTDHLATTVMDPEGDISRIREASTRAASLTRQMLAFARQVPAEPRILRVDDVVLQMVRLLLRVLGEDIAIETKLTAGDARANFDPGQLELVLMNLAVNARDAMPSGGKLLLSTRATDVEVVIEATDTGAGMDETTRARAFEPFFTTKSPGEGTGLGLSTCYGIVQQLGGRIELDSVIGQGTTARITLPRCAASVDSRRTRPPPAPPRGSETVLLLEDDPLVRRATHRMLKTLGYQVLDAALPSEALSLARDHAGTIDVLVTDVVMPQMNGVQAATAFRELRPNAGVLFVTGYSADAFPSPNEIERSHHLSKPFSMSDLAGKLRAILG